MYREQTFAEPCAACEQPSVRACGRCARPTCAAHVLDADGLCVACETEWTMRPRRTLPGLPFLVTGGSATALGIAFVAGGPLAAVGAMFGVMATLAGVVLYPRERVRRRSFVAELRGDRPLALPPPTEQR